MPVDRPRDRKQCENVQHGVATKRKFSNDEYFSTLELAVQTDSFVRQFTVYPDLVIHLGSETILSTTKKLLQLSSKYAHLKQVISYDTTFLLGDYYVSVLVARNTYFDGDPIYPVAFLIHERKYLKHHREFLRDVLPAIGMTRAKNVPIVTDREKGITKCLKTHFPRLTNLFCTNHILRDVEYWLKQYGGKEDLKVL